MLYAVDSGEFVKKLPHRNDFNRWRKHLADADYVKITEELNRKIDGSDINTAGWIPGRHWGGTVYEPIWRACGENEVQAAMFFGLILFKTLMERDDNVWGFGRFNLDGQEIRSMTYFTFENPPSIK